MKKKILCAGMAAMMALIPLVYSGSDITASAVLGPDESGAYDRIDDDMYVKTDEYWYLIRPDETVCIARYMGSEKDVTVPSEIDGHTVTSVWGYIQYHDDLATGAFADTDIVSLVIPDTATEILPALCEKCDELEKLVIGGSVKEIEAASFAGLPKLNEVQIGTSVKKIGTQAFDFCPELKEITIPRNVEEIGEWAFGFTCPDNDIKHEVDPDFTVYCYSGTAGEEYAVTNGINYVLLDDKKPDDGSKDILGDINGDGAVDIEDAVAIVGHINGQTMLSAEQEKLADVDKSGAVDIEDAAAVINLINGVKALD